ncbi:MAG: MerR family transcriptional regulator [Gudongella sp.]|nr:MerR family transcriptional regulator [Gudongella sp.]
MLINQTSKKTNLTKKAIEYYTEQGLISPVILENGYRGFSEDDVEDLYLSTENCTIFQSKTGPLKKKINWSFLTIL